MHVIRHEGDRYFLRHHGLLHFSVRYFEFTEEVYEDHPLYGKKEIICDFDYPLQDPYFYKIILRYEERTITAIKLYQRKIDEQDQETSD